MLRLTTILVLVISFYSCDRARKNNISFESINELHQQIDSIPKDSVFSRLKNAQYFIKENRNIPDSVIAYNNYLIGLHFNSVEQIDSAATYFHNAMDFVRDSIKDDKQGLYFVSAFRAYKTLGLSGDCLIIFKKHKSLIQPLKHPRALAWSHYFEYEAYVMAGDFQKVHNIVEERIAHARLNDTASLPAALGALAGIKYDYLNDKEGAFTIMNELLTQQDKYSNNMRRQINERYGIYQYYEGDFRLALKHYLISLENEKSNIQANKSDISLNSLANCYSNIAEVYMDLKQYNLAKTYLDSVKRIGIKNMDRNKQRALLNYQLRLAMETNKNSKEVTKVVDSIYEYQNEIYLQNSKNELLELTKVNKRQRLLFLEKQAADIKNIKLQTRSIILIISLILSALIGVLFYGQRKLKFEKQSLQLQQRLFRSQMNPHFTYNTLYSIQKEIKKDPSRAENYLLKFSRLLRLVLENSMNNYVLLSKELEAVQKYLDLQQIHATNKFEYQVILDNLEEDELIFIPPMLLQPIIENSIEHGFSGINYKGELKLTLALKDKYIRCSIEDNGKGLQNSNSSEKQSASTELIQDFLKKSTKEGFKIINRQDENPNKSGLLVQFLIPYKFTEND